MIAICIAAAGHVTAIAATAFTLSWTHSVEKTEWREAWALKGNGLVMTEARVKGSGAGMDPGKGAVLNAGWWVWKPELPAVPRLTLAASGATQSAWTFCASSECRELGAKPEAPIVIEPCDQ